ncbi:DUF3060 domain-containing protein [Curtobacterium flaccumfaciens pv. oortii]|uniref:DUF3060 domain-containing protein n=1 Tax=Curtobacterium flaccumfaciens TaxID=2035 RepID=UPI001BDF4DA4|nr:DUF3060 domain-containing protein [Curtobacterium flaccumfaciens]MBT1624255.1 DUF3060 domain-containing protein [Curtobacterium flaccumfaciens pv. oortii]
MRTTTRIGITAAAAFAAMIALAGCTSTSTTSEGPASKTPSASPSASVASGVADDSGKCVDGVSTPVKSKSKFSLDSCDFVDVMGSGNTVTAAPLKKLTIEGSKNTITVKSVGEVTTVGDGNTIYYSGAEPTHHEHGTGTKLMPLSSQK